MSDARVNLTVALRRATAVDQVLVVSSDHGAQRIAGGYGATVLEEPDRGHNDAAGQGVREALELGAEIVNDPSGLTFDPGLAKTVAQANAGLILNHMRGSPESSLRGMISAAPSDFR